MPVLLHREPGSVHDGDTVMAYIESGSKYVALGHLEKDVANMLAPMMDSLSGFRCIALVIYIKSLIKLVTFSLHIAPQ